MEYSSISSEPSAKTSAKDFFLNLGAIVALYTTVVSLLNLLFTVINGAYPQINSYSYGNSSISFPVATLIIFFPLFILTMWLLEKSYVTEPDKKHAGVRKWLTYATLFIAGLTLAGDLVTVLYYFLDGQDLTAGFILKVFSVLVVSLMVFMYYIQDIHNKLNSKKRKVWTIFSACLLLASIIWGFAVLGSPVTQRLLRYDNQRISDLQNIQYDVISYWQTNGAVPASFNDMESAQPNTSIPRDPQTKDNYEYNKTGVMTFELCVVFNKASNKNGNRTATAASESMPDFATLKPVSGITLQNNNWDHGEGRQCFERVIDPAIYPTQVKG